MKSFIVVISVATILTACGTSGGSSSQSKDSSAPTTVSAANTPATVPRAPHVKAKIPTGPVPKQFVGTYTYDIEGGVWHITLRGDGTYTQWNPNGDQDINGSWGIKGRKAIFGNEHLGKHGGGAACTGNGVYGWRFKGRKLLLHKIKDYCTVGRIEQWTAGWTKISDQVLGHALTLKKAEK